MPCQTPSCPRPTEMGAAPVRWDPTADDRPQSRRPAHPLSSSDADRPTGQRRGPGPEKSRRRKSGPVEDPGTERFVVLSDPAPAVEKTAAVAALGPAVDTAVVDRAEAVAPERAQPSRSWPLAEERRTAGLSSFDFRLEFPFVLPHCLGRMRVTTSYERDVSLTLKVIER